VAARKSYNCLKCPAFCCSYPRIEVKPRDLERLAAHFGVELETARRRYTKKSAEPGERVLRHQADPHFRTICQFIDLETRRCTIYHARPAICRQYPGASRCGYYDFLKFDRAVADDPEFVARTDHL